MKQILAALGSQAGLLFVGLVALFWLGQLNHAQDTAITSASQQQLAKHPWLVRFRDSLQTVEHQYGSLAAVSHQTANELRHEMDSARTHPDTIRLLERIAVADSTAYAKCSLAFQTCEARAASAEAEADSLNKRLTAQVKVRDHRFGIYAGGGGCVPSTNGWCANVSFGLRLWP